MNVFTRNQLIGTVYVLAAFAAVAPLRAQSSMVPLWVNIKSVTLNNQTAPIVTPYVLYTPAQSATFRVSFFVEPISTTLAPGNSDTFYPGIT
jgi:hypothetical protein